MLTIKIVMKKRQDSFELLQGKLRELPAGRINAVISHQYLSADEKQQVKDYTAMINATSLQDLEEMRTTGDPPDISDLDSALRQELYLSIAKRNAKLGRVMPSGE